MHYSDLILIPVLVSPVWKIWAFVRIGSAIDWGKEMNNMWILESSWHLSVRGGHTFLIWLATILHRHVAIICEYTVISFIGDTANGIIIQRASSWTGFGGIFGALVWGLRHSADNGYDYCWSKEKILCPFRMFFFFFPNKKFNSVQWKACDCMELTKDEHGRFHVDDWNFRCCLYHRSKERIQLNWMNVEWNGMLLYTKLNFLGSSVRYICNRFQ